MLHAQAYGKGFRLHGKAFFIKHGKGISGAVANGKDTDLGRKLFSVFQLYLIELVVFKFSSP
ncbi:hypothetical protein EVA_09111 [gut metagenome]|uniref:Uncharacterized protein n=1 Tax=gut metagenome TaxID=749906 RepID=J9GRK5_9ZZZZ